MGLFRLSNELFFKENLSNEKEIEHSFLLYTVSDNAFFNLPECTFFLTKNRNIKILKLFYSNY